VAYIRNIIVVVHVNTVRLFAATNGPSVHPPGNMGMERHSGMTLTGENQRTWIKTYPSATLSTTNPTWTDSVLHDEKPATNYLRHGMASSFQILYLKFGFSLYTRNCRINPYGVTLNFSQMKMHYCILQNSV
jgi:hypothetical protein